MKSLMWASQPANGQCARLPLFCFLLRINWFDSFQRASIQCMDSFGWALAICICIGVEMWMSVAMASTVSNKYFIYIWYTMQSAILLHSSLTYCDMVHNSHNLCYTAEVTSLNFKPMVDPVHRIDSFFNRVIFFLFSCFFYSQLIDHQIDLNHIANEIH